jgi:hypothetical protein
MKNFIKPPGRFVSSLRFVVVLSRRRDASGARLLPDKLPIAFFGTEIPGFSIDRRLIGLAERQIGMTAGILDKIFRYGRSVPARYRFGRFRGRQKKPSGDSVQQIKDDHCGQNPENNHVVISVL